MTQLSFLGELTL